MNYFENKKALNTVRIVGFTDEYRGMLTEFLSRFFTVTESDANILVCEDGKSVKNHPTEKTVVIGNEKKQGKGKSMYFTRPVDLATLSAVMVSMAGADGDADLSEEYVSDPVNRTVSLGGKTVRLTSLEFRLFMLLHSHQGETVSRENIRKTLHNTDEGSNMPDVYICYLRRKLEEIAGKGALISVRGKGYILAVPK